MPEPEDLGTLAEEKVVGVATEWDKNNAKGETKETEYDRRRFSCQFISAAAAAVFGVLAMSFYRVDEEVFLLPSTNLIGILPAICQLLLLIHEFCSSDDDGFL